MAMRWRTHLRDCSKQPIELIGEGNCCIGQLETEALTEGCAQQSFSLIDSVMLVKTAG